ncbi:MAG: alpha/beta hydrolase [Acidimicrobiia bacterium]|nr:alpha/beta hydrolase [Acidimicrobiia bacterium]
MPPTPFLPTGRHEVVGDLDELGVLAAPGILPRRAFVWKPPRYDPRRPHPVLYMHDGLNLVSPETASYGADWQVDEVAAGLIAAGRMEPILIVGAECTPGRMDEYGDTEAGRAYLRFLVEDLKPLVDRRYRTRPGRESTAVMGSSMGGLISLLAVFLHGGVFGGAGCLSPAFPDTLCEQVAASAWPDCPRRLYLDNGGVGLDAELQPGLDRMLAILEAKGFRRGEDLDVVIDPRAEHHEEAWAARVWRPLEFLFGSP